jgi:hypothetical protein
MLNASLMFYDEYLFLPGTTQPIVGVYFIALYWV